MLGFSAFHSPVANSRKAKTLKTRSFAVIGLGTFGSTVASELARFGNPVLGIDTDERNVSRLADTLSEAIIADGRDEAALREAGVGNYDVAIVAIGEDLEANILCTMNVKLLGVKTIWAKALSRTHHRILSKLGADRVILPEQEIGQHIAQMLHNPLVRDYVSLGNGYHVVDLRVPPQLDGKPIGDAAIFKKYELRPLGAMRDSQFLSCESGDLELREGDKLLVLGRRTDLRSFGDDLRGGS
ncbi:TrkA family potassium uptake protein [Actibacterium sp. MT2.3-13A]|uniref:potassium channel family protein n=1 Tax=Actibacterium sp. MT2.3-13A TaxID=2828332 RepID=UPI002011AF93|nr:TrkA family potassium uptake protein [Actibacterium sp. MT2.3-13A]